MGEMAKAGLAQDDIYGDGEDWENLRHTLQKKKCLSIDIYYCSKGTF